MAKKTKPKILSIESLYINTSEGQKVQRFARTLIDAKSKKTRQIIDHEKKWQDVPEAVFHKEAEERREQLIAELSGGEPQTEETGK